LSENQQQLDSQVDEPALAPNVAVTAEENEINSVSDEVLPEEVQTADAKESPSIDYDFEDIHEEEEPEDEEDEDAHDELGKDSPDDAGTTLLPIEEIVQHLRDLLQSDNPKRKDVDEYKNQFYRSLRIETENQKQAFLNAGGEEIDFIVKEPELFVEGKELLQKIKEKRSVIAAQEEAEKEKNLARKLAIIDQIKLLTETQGQEDFNKSYQEFKSLQQEWNDIKQVPQAKVNELWKSYQHYVEKFYDLVRINNEFREYDFREKSGIENRAL